MKHRLPHNEQKELERIRAGLLRSWRAWHQERLEQALAGAHSTLIAELVTILDRLELTSSATLLELMQRADWDAVDADTRFEVLHLINARIAKMRERHGLPAIDDPLPSQPDNVFRRIKTRLFNSHCSGNARPEVDPAKCETVGVEDDK
jgi:hypothetical protein